MPTTASVRINPGLIARRIGVLRDRDLRKRAERVASRARQLAPGSMKRAITTELTGQGRDRTALVTLTHPAAAFVTKGTRAHIIRPRTARVLRFTSGSRVIFARRVLHPGTRPNEFMRRAMEAAR